MLFKVDGDTTLEQLRRVLDALQPACVHWTCMWDKHIVTVSGGPRITVDGRGSSFIEALTAALEAYYNHT